MRANTRDRHSHGRQADIDANRPPPSKRCKIATDPQIPTPPASRSLYAHKQASDPHVKRSSRVKVAPLAYWANEHIAPTKIQAPPASEVVARSYTDTHGVTTVSTPISRPLASFAGVEDRPRRKEGPRCRTAAQTVSSSDTKQPILDGGQDLQSRAGSTMGTRRIRKHTAMPVPRISSETAIASATTTKTPRGQKQMAAAAVAIASGEAATVRGSCRRYTTHGLSENSAAAGKQPISRQSSPMPVSTPPQENATAPATLQPATEPRVATRRSHRCRASSNRVLEVYQGQAGNESEKACGREEHLESAAAQQAEVTDRFGSAAVVNHELDAPPQQHAPNPFRDGLTFSVAMHASTKGRGNPVKPKMRSVQQLPRKKGAYKSALVRRRHTPLEDAATAPHLPISSCHPTSSNSQQAYLDDNLLPESVAVSTIIADKKNISTQQRAQPQPLQDNPYLKATSLAVPASLQQPVGPQPIGSAPVLSKLPRPCLPQRSLAPQEGQPMSGNKAPVHGRHALTAAPEQPISEGAGIRCELPAVSGDGSSMWTESQLSALVEAQATEDPVLPNFWRRVAAHVPGKTVEDCIDQAIPSPTQTRRPTSAAAATKPLNLPPISNLAGGKVTQAAARKYSREVRIQDRLKHSRELAASGIGDSCREQTMDEAALLQEAAERRKRGRYIDAFRRRNKSSSQASVLGLHLPPTKANVNLPPLEFFQGCLAETDVEDSESEGDLYFTD